MNLFLIFQYGLVGAFVVLLGTFLLVMVSESVEGGISPLFGLDAKNETLTFLGIGMGGVLLALQALMSYRRAKALEETAKAQADATKEQAKANQNTEQGQRQERLKNAIEHLGHDKDSVRLGGAYELFHLAQDTKDLRQTVLDILCAHIRRTTGEDEYREKYNAKPSEEIQSLLTLLFVQEHEVFKGLHISLQGSWLNGADLKNARLENAVLNRAQLQGAQLGRARLQGATLEEAWLQGAQLTRTQLQGAQLGAAWLQGASLGAAWLQGASLGAARLQGATLEEAWLQGAQLTGAQLQGVVFTGAQLQGAELEGAQLQGVTSRGALYAPFEEKVRDRIGRPSGLSGVIFVGGLSQEDLDSFVEGLSDEEGQELREKLEPHLGTSVSHELPEDSGAITGAYTAEEAEQWIAEYKKVMSEVPKESDN